MGRDRDDLASNACCHSSRLVDREGGGGPGPQEIQTRQHQQPLHGHRVLILRVSVERRVSTVNPKYEILHFIFDSNPMHFILHSNPL